MNNRWTTQDAGSRFDELLDAALTEGPQIVTKHGVDTAVVVDVEQWRRLEKTPRPNLKELLLASEARTDNLTPQRRNRSYRIPLALH